MPHIEQVPFQESSTEKTCALDTCALDETCRGGTTIETYADMASHRSWWTWNLGRVAGIPIRMHLTLLILLAWIAGTYAITGAGFSATALGVALVMAIFVVIVVHELGHALVARRYGIGTRDIMLLPIGGIASLERIPENPKQE